MNKTVKAVITLLFVAAAVTVVTVKKQRTKSGGEKPAVENSTETKQQLPKLLDLGSHSCVPCKMMMPILDTLTEVHAGKLAVEFIDVWQDRDAGETYGIRAIPTQIIFDASGAELYRHEGYWGRAEIESKLKELGIELGQSS